MLRFLPFLSLKTPGTESKLSRPMVKKWECASGYTFVKCGVQILMLGKGVLFWLWMWSAS